MKKIFLTNTVAGLFSILLWVIFVGQVVLPKFHQQWIGEGITFISLGVFVFYTAVRLIFNREA